jgi:hypothetical protein
MDIPAIKATRASPQKGYPHFTTAKLKKKYLEKWGRGRKWGP